MFFHCATGGVNKDVNKTCPSCPSECGARLGGQEHPTAPGAGPGQSAQLLWREGLGAGMPPAVGEHGSTRDLEAGGRRVWGQDTCFGDKALTSTPKQRAMLWASALDGVPTLHLSHRFALYWGKKKRTSLGLCLPESE